MSYAYPNDVYDKPRNLLAALGSWWASQYDGKEQVSAIVSALAGTQQQSSQNMLELLDSMSRQTVPIYHTDNWYELRLSQREQTEVTAANVLQYDDGITYDAGYIYDSRAVKPYFSHALPTGLREVPLLMNQFISPDLVWSPQLDYKVTPATIIFYADPFADPRVLKQPVYKDGALIDYVAILWVYRGQWDWDTIYQQFGYILKLRMQSSRGYRDILNAAYDALLTGGAGVDILQMLAVMTGIPLTRYNDERVLEITQDAGGQLVVTDKAAYRLPNTATVSVAVGDIVAKRTSLATALQIYELNRPTDISDIPAIALGSGFLSSCMYGDLLFPNKSVPLEVITDDPSGFTKLQWPLGGFPLDVTQFFDELHARGVLAATTDIDTCSDDELLERTGELTEYGSIGISSYVRKATLAHLLDTRLTPIDEPTADALPTTINPCQFLVDNIFNKNTTIIVLRTADFSASGVGLQNLRLLHRILPPQTALLLMLELDVTKDTVTPDNFSESLETWVGVEIFSDAITVPYVADRGLTVRIVSGA